MRLVMVIGEAQLKPDIVDTYPMFNFKEHFGSFLW